jgi:hypothetical protein
LTAVLRTRVSILLLLAVLALPASSAAASIYSQVLHAYQTDGSVPPCQFSSQQLDHALKGIDTYGAQYFQDFTSAIQAALTSRASGRCAPTHGIVLPAAAGQAQSPSRPLALGPVGAATSSSVPAPILLLALLGLLIALTAAVGSFVWWRGWSAAWAASWTHAWSETGYRFHNGWLDFRDWLRSGSEPG